MEFLRLISREQIILHRLPKDGNFGDGAISKSRFFSFHFVVALASHVSLSLVKNISRKVVLMPFDFSKGILLAVDTLCEADVLRSGF